LSSYLERGYALVYMHSNPMVAYFIISHVYSSSSKTLLFAYFQMEISCFIISSFI